MGNGKNVKENNIKRKGWGRWLRGAFLALMVLTVCAGVTAVPKDVQAAKTGFCTIGGKGYYINRDGSRHKGWKTIGGKKYFFDYNTGVQKIGWQRSRDGEFLRYFTNAYGPRGYMATGFRKDKAGDIRYFNPKDGMMVKGWAYDNGNHRYFDPKTGAMYTGVRKVGNCYYYFLTNPDPAKSGYRYKKGFATVGNKRYYFSSKDGHALIGWRSLGGKTYYFGSDGVMYTGIRKVGRYYYFFGSSGIRCQSGFKEFGVKGTSSYKKYYFNPKDGHANIGWMPLKGKKYYFNSKGVMYSNTTLYLGGKKYRVDENGVVTEITSKYDYKVESGYVRAYDKKNGRYYYLAKEFAQHPGVADGRKTDRDLLAAICEAEAGDQGLVGMEAVALCLLNRTIKPDREFPSELRYVLYQQGSPTAYPQYSPVRDGALVKRLNGNFIDRTAAYKAADSAIKKFNDYVVSGKPRTLEGFDRKDFDFMYFMMESSFWRQPLDFGKVDNFLYKDHMFFVDWV